MCLLLTSCIRITNLQDRAIVQAIGIDIKDGEFAVTMQIFSPDGSGGQTLVDPTKQNSRVITTYGKSIAEALEETSVSQGKVFFLGHNRLIILGEGTKKYNLSEVLDFFTTSSRSRADVKVLTTAGEAYDILSKDINQGILPALSIEKTVENAFDNSKIANTFLLDVLKNENVLLPVINPYDNQGEKELKTIELSGCAVYKNGEYKGDFNLEETRGAILLKGWGKRAVYSKNGLSLQIYDCDTRLRNGRIILKLKAEVLENVLEENNEKALEIAENKIVKEITLQCNNAISKAEKYQIDFFKSDEFEIDLVTRNQN